MSSAPHFQVEYRGAVVVVHLRDEWPADARVQQWRTAFRALLAEKRGCHLVVDLREVPFFEANFRGLLVWLYREAREQGHQLAVCGLSPCMSEHPTLIDFGRLFFTSCGNVEEALAALSPAEGAQ